MLLQRGSLIFFIFQTCCTTFYLTACAYTSRSLEANVNSYHTSSNQLVRKAREKALLSYNDHPKCVALAAGVPKHPPNFCSFRRKANALSTLLPDKLEHHQFIKHFPFPLWQSSALCKEYISTCSYYQRTSLTA